MINTYLLAILATTILLFYCQNYVLADPEIDESITNERDQTNPLSNAEEEVADDKERTGRSAYKYNKNYPNNPNWGGGSHSSGLGAYGGIGGYGIPDGVKVGLPGYGRQGGYGGYGGYGGHSGYGSHTGHGGYGGYPNYNYGMGGVNHNYGGCSPPKIPSNGEIFCQDGKCKIACNDHYEFADGTRSYEIKCFNGQWTQPTNFELLHTCHAICKPACQNDGICISPHKCECAKNFYGPLCQYQRNAEPCPDLKFNTKNGFLYKCSDRHCSIQCLRGFQFPDGSNVTSLECKDGKWMNKKTGLQSIPQCLPICRPPCENGGECITSGVCKCIEKYRGSRCQYGSNTCSLQNKFLGNSRCRELRDMSGVSCRLECPKDVPGLVVKGSLQIDYICKYDENIFRPPLPKCIYPPGYTVQMGPEVQRTLHEKYELVLGKYRTLLESRRTEMISSEEVSMDFSSYSLYITNVDTSSTVASPQRTMCTTWGGNHVKTFDGLMLKTSLSCWHTLVEDMQGGTFILSVKGCPRESGYGCAHILKIFWQTEQYTVRNLNGTLQLFTSSRQWPIPSLIKGMKVTPLPQRLQIELDVIGVTIEWDKHQYISISVGRELWGKLGGLCGSWDGDDRNDMKSPGGVLLQTVKTFADTWRSKNGIDIDECTVENDNEDKISSKCANTKQNKALDVCSRLLLSEKMENCTKLFDFDSLIKDCMDDYCNCPNQEHVEACNCDTMEMLAKECLSKGVEFQQGWRNSEICPIECSGQRVYMSCGPDVEPSCDSAMVSTKGKCNEGCFCPEGMVQYDDSCILPDLCPCMKGGKKYNPESTVKKHCNTCVCKSGKWNCTDNDCGARCSAIGDPHYQTFDGKRFDFMGKCSYHLLKMPQLSVEAENVGCSGAISENMNFAGTSDDPSCTKSVTVRFVQRNGIPTTIRLDQGLEVSVNGKPVMHFPKVIGQGETLIRHASSTFMTVDFPDGMRIWWDGVSRVYIDAPPGYRNKTAGLCGTFNSNTEDDFLTPEGDVETAVLPFADKWRTKDTCLNKAEGKDGPNPCTVNPDMRKIAEEHCARIMDDTFQECNWVVEPEQYYENCMYDVCACKGDAAKCFCPILSAYGTECMRQGIKTSWQLSVKECAVKCPVGQIYDECGNSCSRTCEDLAFKSTCKRECVEGCRCPKGEYLNENNECVPQDKCSCVFEGVKFKPGYKEVRPGERFLDLCTCVGGTWECQDAETGDEEKYPPSSEIRSKCNKKPFAEFLECAAKERKTCKNMHEYVEDLDECKPGCACLSGYVYDTTRDTCVLPEHCSCQHGGKSYSDGDQIKEDCNVCVCQSGKWKCTSQECDSTCSVWGDSHFSTFDNLDYDFQGTCSYVLAKGVADNGDGFAITIQNVLCGTMGVTCSKSLEISLSGSVMDTLTLTANPDYAADSEQTTINKLRDVINAKTHGEFHVYRVGIFVVIEVIPLSMQIKWDEGTRIYVKLGKEWRNKVSGLCGNYNNNAQDDMQTPSQSLETSALVFGHSWKIGQQCMMPTQPIDACKEHSEREMWAQMKCGILKSKVFQACHGEVPVEKYLKRCIFDSCACDMGGDCECLCTAIAAYAHSCSQKGVSIKWRTPHLCPMQCDSHCSEYKSCTPSCPVETCDNFLEVALAHSLCNKENCIEGCAIKPCENGMIYSNDSFTECVPKSDCKPICMFKDGTTYYEGDITYQDDCATCRCSKKKEICSGLKCSKPTSTENPAVGITTSFIETSSQPKCVRGWTRWFDKDTDESTNVLRLNEEEKLPRYDRLEDTYGTCEKKYMKDIECRVVKTHESYDYMDENVSCDLDQGLVCRGQCHDYEVRVFCVCDEFAATTPMPTERPGLECNTSMPKYKEIPGDCHKYIYCERKPDGRSIYKEQTCEKLMFNPITNICDSVTAVQQIRPECEEQTTDCPVGQIMSDCANQCEHTCHFYGKTLMLRGLCKENEYCKPGCVPANRPNCPQMGKLWRDEDTCVDVDECPCMDEDEQYVKPNMPREYKSHTCQCFGNDYNCVPNVISETTTITTAATEMNTNDVTDVTETYETIFPSSTSPPLECSPERLVSMIEGSDPLPDSVFSASSQRGPSYGPEKARLYMDSKEQITGSWAPNINDQMQYLQVTFSQPESLFGVIMAGNPEINNYVKLFKILYSYDGLAYNYLTDETESPQFFVGPPNGRQAVKSLFKIPIEAKSLRIYPLKWHGSIAMRVELLGCGEGDYTTTTTERIEVITVHPTEKGRQVEPIECNEPMGVENGKLRANQVKASSVSINSKSAKKPRLIDLLKLSSTVGWKPMGNMVNEYIEFDFVEPRNISGIITKGGSDGWVTAYKIEYGRAINIWNTMLESGGETKIYVANHNKNEEKANYFTTPILTRYLRIKPISWEKNINMRIEPMGCFVEYPILRTETNTTSKIIDQSSCPVCEGVTRRLTDSKACECSDNLFWNGTACGKKSLCPCVNDIIYSVGSKFMNKECESCICRLGGESYCKRKACPACEGNLHPVMGVDCMCKCKECPPGQRICTSTLDCVPETFWCSNLKECGDGQNEDICEKKYAKQSTPPPIVSKCPVATCPPGMEKKTRKNKSSRVSQIFTHTKQVVSTEGNKKRVTVETQVLTSSEEYTFEMPEHLEDLSTPEEECEEFTCVPMKGAECPEPECPKGYKIKLVPSNKNSPCQSYNCVLPPLEDVKCEISGKSFKTFDGTKFTYEICSHALVRDMNSSWRISIQRQCDEAHKICHRVVVIRDYNPPAELVLLPEMKLKFNSFLYTVSQLMNSPICKASFDIFQSGKTVHVVSNKYKFWVRYEDIGRITIGLSPKNIRTVDGLCGYYDEISSNDKRAPNGTIMTKVAQFGDSWYDSKIPKDECKTQMCPLGYQSKAFALCSTVKLHNFKKCSEPWSLEQKQFINSCVEPTCECLMASNGDSKSCKCKLLEDYVSKCLAENPNVQLTTAWRVEHSCEISCPAPFVHYDCYKRSCEPSCDTLDDDACPIIPDMCFSGCYCPEGTVRKGDNCVQMVDCKDCLCNSYGTSKYITYDQQSFTFNGDCTYLLSRDIILPHAPAFEIYVTMEDCQKLGLETASTNTSCAKALHLINGDHVVHVHRQVQAQPMRIVIDSFNIEKLPHKDRWITVGNVNAKEVLISLQDTPVDLTVFVDDFSFSIAVPSIKFGSKMQGLCGDCDGNPNNDLTANSAKRQGLKLADVIQSWQSNEPKLGPEANECHEKNVTTTECVPAAADKDLCLEFYKKAHLDQCLQIVDPANYILSCQKGMCLEGADKDDVCDSLNAYAKECARHGICLDWRRPDVCPYMCPPEMVYKPCGCAKTCETVQNWRSFDTVNIDNNTYMPDMTVKEELQKCTDAESFEGCFCPDGKVMDNGKCVDMIECMKCEDGKHLPGDKWKKGKCIKCSCDEERKIYCEAEKCIVQGNICEDGHKEQKVQDPTKCCPSYLCVKEPEKPKEECPEPVMPKCGLGQIMKKRVDTNNCTKFYCDCKPKEDCEPLEQLENLKPGQIVVKDDSGCCPTQNVICDESTCPRAQNNCSEEFYEVVVKKEPDDCCEQYACEPPKDFCIVENKLNGRRSKIAVNGDWQYSMCRYERCVPGPNGFPQIIDKPEICNSQCAIGQSYIHNDAEKCCGECVQTECVHEGQLYKPGARWKSPDQCTTYVCNPDNMHVMSSIKDCPDVSNCPKEFLVQDEEGCCELCNIVRNEWNTSALTQCLPVVLAEHETKELIKVSLGGHGKCFNKEPIPNLTTCQGTCRSGSVFNSHTFKQDKFCSCCSVKSYKTIPVNLICEDGYPIVKKIDVPEACECAPCIDSVDLQKELEIDVRSYESLLPRPGQDPIK